METQDLQKRAHDHAMSGKNFFLTGSAGTGKTHTLRSIIKSLKESKKRVAVTACTGVAAQQFGSEAKTIHSFAGYSFDDGNFHAFRSGWRYFDVLIIDEISMLSSVDFKKIEICAKLARENNLPMGGIQVIGCGDFFQLPPTYDNGPKPGRKGSVKQGINAVKSQSRNKEAEYAFHASSWRTVFPIMVNLTKVHRQKHQDFIEILNRIRSDEFLRGVHEYLIENCGTTFNPDVPYIFATNEKVDKLNKHKSDQITTNFIEYKDKFKKVIKLAVGVPVIGLINEGPMRNGSRGVVIGFEYNNEPYHLESLEPGEKHPHPVNPVVKFQLDDNPMTIEMSNANKHPITQGWAMTIHKAQGMTFESLNVDISQCKSPGQVYVALSRVPDPSRLNLAGYNDRLVKRGQFVSLFYESFEPIPRIPGDPE
jgi:Cdc6-like AAA superfamily ATPase